MGRATSANTQAAACARRACPAQAAFPKRANNREKAGREMITDNDGEFDMAHRITVRDLLPWLAAAGGGVLTFLGYAGSDQFYLEWICLVPILWAIRKQSPVRAFFIGWVAGVIAHGGGFYWVIHMFREFAGMPWPPAFLGLVLLAAANGIVFAVWAGATRFIVGATGWSMIWVSPVIWTALEKFWPEIFPNYLGASQYTFTLLTQMADVTGVLGITFLIVYANSFIYVVLERRFTKLPFPKFQTAIFAAVIGVVLTYGAVRIHSVDQDAAAAPKLTVGLVQTNRGAGEKHADRDRFLREHVAMSRELVFRHKPDLLVWPENVLMADITSRRAQLPPSLFGDLGTPVLFGAILRIGEN